MAIFNIRKQNNHVIFNFLGIRVKFKYSDFMGYKIEGKNNKIVIVKNGKEKILSLGERIKGLDIRIVGNDNYIKIACNNIKNSIIDLRSNKSNIIIEKSPRIYDLYIGTCYGNNQKLIWGNGSTCWGVKILLNEENAKCVIGKNCLFSSGIEIWTTDGHTIIDKKTHKILNLEKRGVIIGNNCWIGTRVEMCKNTILPKNTIVGACSLISHEFVKENTIIAGNPAKVIKENVIWKYPPPTVVSREENNMDLLSDTEMIEDII